jgi:anti-sigma-K factor RskA
VNDRPTYRDDEQLDEALVAYCLGALTDAERRDLEAAVPASQLHAAVAHYAPALEALALGVPEREPPAALRHRVLAAADATPGAPPRRRVVSFSTLPWLAAAALLLVAIGLGTLLWRQSAELRDLRAALNAPRVVSMERTAIAPQAQGRFYLAPESHQGILLVVDMPPLPTDRVYQLWLAKPEGGRDDGGTFRVDSGGYGTYLVRAPQPLGRYSGLGITVEPVGGSPGPTSPRVIGGSFATSTAVDW